jgi:cell division inhibitor SulA
MKPRRWDTRELKALADVATVVQGLTALRQVEWLPPLTSEEFRDLAGATGRAIEAAMRLHESGNTRVEPAEQLALLKIASGLGRDLARASERTIAGHLNS